MSTGEPFVKESTSYYTPEQPAAEPEAKQKGRRRTGQATTKTKRRRKECKPEAPPAAIEENGEGQANDQAVPVVPAVPVIPEGFVLPPGRFLNQYEKEEIRYLIPGYVGYGFLNLCTGKNDVGKSALLSSAIGQAGFTILFPSAEEGVGLKLKNRLEYLKVDQSKIFVPSDGEWQLPDCKRRLIALVEHFKARFETKNILVAWDNMSSYVGAGLAENDATVVGPALDAAGEVAIATGAALFGNRHPGKGKDNDIRGSSDWLWKPRVVLKLTLDPGSEDRGVIRHLRNTFGDGRQERHYRIEKDGGAPGIFVLGAKLSDKEKEILAGDDEELARISKKRQALEVISKALADGRVEACAMYNLAESLRIGHTTYYLAGLQLKVEMYQEGFTSKERKDWWELPQHFNARIQGVTPSL